MLDKMRSIEAQALQAADAGADATSIDRSALLRIAGLYLVVVLGVLASWFWGVGWEYLADTSKPISFGPPIAIVVRVILAFIAAALTFNTVYGAIGKGTKESAGLPVFIAFQNGFFWDALFAQIQQQIAS